MLQSSAEITLKTHRKVAFELLTRPAARLLWQRGLDRAVLMEGEAGHAGAVTALSFRRGRQTHRMIETVLSADSRSALHVQQQLGEDLYTLHYGFFSLRPGQLRLVLTVEFKPGSAVDALRGYFDKKLKTLAAERLQELGDYIDEQNHKRRARRARRRARTAAAPN